MTDLCKFVTVKVHHSLECLTSGKIFMNPMGEGCVRQLSSGFCFYGFSLLRAFGNPVAYPTQGQKSRYVTIAAKPRAFPVKSLEIGPYDLLPANEPWLNYTDTSFDSIGQGKSIPLGVGVDLLFPTLLPSVSYSLQF